MVFRNNINKDKILRIQNVMAVCVCVCVYVCVCGVCVWCVCGVCVCVVCVFVYLCVYWINSYIWTLCMDK